MERLDARLVMKATEKQIDYMLVLMKQTNYEFLEDILPKDKDEARQFISKMVKYRDNISKASNFFEPSGFYGRDQNLENNSRYFQEEYDLGKDFDGVDWDQQQEDYGMMEPF